MGKPPGTPVNLLATDAIVWNIQVSWGFPAGAGDTAYTELEQATTSNGQDPLLLANVSYPSVSYQHGPMLAGVSRWYRERLVDRIGNKGDWTAWIRGGSSSDASEILGNITEGFLTAEDGRTSNR